MKKMTLDLKKPLASWVWDVSCYIVYPNEMLEFCQNNHVTHLYINLDEQLPCEYYADFITLCSRQGIRLIALTGEPTWVLPENRDDCATAFTMVREIHALCKSGIGFEGIQFDVLPYVDTVRPMISYEENLVNFAEYVKKETLKRGLRLQWDIPAWYTEKINQQSGLSLAESMFRICDELCVLAYRDTAVAQFNILQKNIDLAMKYGKRLMIGCETLNVDELRRTDGNSEVSYFEEGKQYMYRSLEILRDEIEKRYTNFGFAIHDMTRWMELQENPLPLYAEVINHEPFRHEHLLNSGTTVALL